MSPWRSQIGHRSGKNEENFGEAGSGFEEKKEKSGLGQRTHSTGEQGEQVLTAYICAIYNIDVANIFDSFVGFQWDRGNQDKNLVKHNVQNWECEQLFFNRPLLVLEDPGHSVAERRWAAFGKTDSGRLLLVIFTKRGSLLRVISARDMNGREKKFYEEKGNKNSEIQE